MAQWINPNCRNNRSVLACLYSVLRKITGPILLPLVGLMAGREAGQQMKYKIICRLNYSGFYFVNYHCNVTTVLKLHFSWLFSSKAYFKVSKEKLVAIIHVNPYYYIRYNDYYKYVMPVKHYMKIRVSSCNEARYGLT